jgi:hypothetical protein
MTIEKREGKKSTSLKLYTDDYTDTLLCTQRGSSIETVGLAPQWPEAIRLGKSGPPEIEQANLHRSYSPVFIPSLDML